MKREEEITDAALEECATGTLDDKWKFVHGAKWADKTMIEKAVNWLKEVFMESDESPHIVSYEFDSTDEMIEDFKEAMED